MMKPFWAQILLLMLLSFTGTVAYAQNGGMSSETSDTERLEIMDREFSTYVPAPLGADEYHRFRLSLQGGIAQWFYRIAEQPEEFQDHYRGLKGGLHFGGNFTYFTGAQFGIGVRYDQFMSDNISIISLIPEEQTEPLDVTLQDEVTIRFAGPQVTLRYYSDDSKRAFIMGIGLGYAGFINEGSFVEFNENYKITGSNMGILAEFSGDFYVGDYVGFGVGITFCMSKLTEAEVDMGSGNVSVALERRDEISLTYAALTLGMRLVK